ncbi:uncharacterized protein TRIADDRAFT_60282 [Trichoplax adhaerens]|uniref:G-protein coupled receptors family 1 profile domain-containing protein n=1 Tax=Trichoplax adhaerens TaxID=10228 RepID=B3S7T1_TRIAD|nr:hypothetical protein TRIADDRAFT_60282 [Trichoplax adhaerens]EDV21345.1 hypothetical protein TRIADDRAFT_60282 [Trichoplax adhaerens]|eukprot:XP_002116312.1 hypothetical protein TRIADDRAFT_60282 [Trichoplax adhaerens]
MANGSNLAMLLLEDNQVARGLAWSFGILGIISNIYVFMGKFRRCRRIFSRHKRTAPEYAVNDSTNDSKNKRVSVFFINNLAVADLLGSFYLLTIASADYHYHLQYSGNQNKYNYHSNQTINTKSWRCKSTLSTTLAPSVNGNLTIGAMWLQDPVCSIARLLITIDSFMSVLITFFIAIDRYITIIHHRSLYRITRRRAIIIMAICWLVGIACSTYIVIRSINTADNDTSSGTFRNLCMYGNLNDVPLQIFLFISIGLWSMSYLLVLVLYAKIIYHVRRVTLVKTRRITAERYLLVIAVMIAFTNLACWLPAILIAMFKLLQLSIVESFTGYKSRLVMFHP